MGIQVRLQGELCACGHQGCMCASGFRICRETGGSLWDNMALERSALARPLIATLYPIFCSWRLRGSVATLKKVCPGDSVVASLQRMVRPLFQPLFFSGLSISA